MTRVAIYGASDAALALIPLLEANPSVEMAFLYDPDPEAVRRRLDAEHPEFTAYLVDSADAIAPEAEIAVVVDGGVEPPLTARFPKLARSGIRILTPLGARLLYGEAVPERRATLLSALREIEAGHALTTAESPLPTDLLAMAISATGARGGSLMMLDSAGHELELRTAVGIDPEIWPKIRIPLGAGVAGAVAAKASPLHIRGPADDHVFRLLRTRYDVATALCLPISQRGRLVGVLNLHHHTDPEAFDGNDFRFAQQLAECFAPLLARHEEQRERGEYARQAELFQRIQHALASEHPLVERLETLCEKLAQWLGRGIASVYLRERSEDDLRLWATSLSGSGFGCELRLGIGEGIEGGAVARREAVFLHDARGALAFAALPLLSGDKALGVLSVQAGAVPPPPAASRALRDIAERTGFEVTRTERETALLAHTSKNDAVFETGLRLLALDDKAEIVRLATAEALRSLEADHAVLRLSSGNGRFPIRSYSGSADLELQKQIFRLDQGLAARAIEQRTTHLYTNLEAESELGAAQAGVRSAMAAPLEHRGRVLGTLSVYDKLPADSFYLGSFDAGDRELFARLAALCARALAAATAPAAEASTALSDSATQLPTAAYFQRRLDEELARAKQSAATLVVASCSIEWPNGLGTKQQPPSITPALLKQVAAALQSSLRGFDVLARTEGNGFHALLPDPGASPEGRVSHLARHASEVFDRHWDKNAGPRPALVFGYAVYPEDGTDREHLLQAAAIPRLRMV